MNEQTWKHSQPLLALVLDDRESSRFVLTSWLTRAGFAVVTASSGAEAIDLIHSEIIDLAILDVHLPDMSGFEVCEAIRANSDTAWIPILHVSATAVEPSSRSEGLLRGADAYLVEPVDPTDFAATVTALVRRAQLRRRMLITTARLRRLNSATADVYAASDDQRLFEAIVGGAAGIVGVSATVVRRMPNGAVKIVGSGEGIISRRTLRMDAVDALLEPARAGATTLFTDDGLLVDEPHTGVSFVDETGEPAGAILVPASVEDVNDEVLPLLAQLAIAITLARANMRALDVEHRIALVLQESLLPQKPPDSEGLRVALRYVAASLQAQVGGDFYEAFALSDTTVALAIGDVVGHSLHAATVMGEIRHAIRAYAIDGYDPVGVITRVERVISTFHPNMYTTAIYGVIDVESGEFRFCNCGHVPLLVVSAGAARFVPGKGALLGIGSPAPAIDTVRLRPGDRLVMVTDGLVERRRELLDDGLERLRRAAGDLAHLDVEAMVDELLAVVGPGPAPGDDIAIVAVELSER